MKTVITQIYKTCNACPAQWEGLTTDDRHIYIRYRWGQLVVSVSKPKEDDIMAAVNGKVIFATDVGGDMDGEMSLEELQEITKNVLQFPI